METKLFECVIQGSDSVEPPVEEKQVIAAALKPRELVKYLDKFIVGQPDAKRAVAIALRNRWRRHKLPDALKSEVRRRNGTRNNKTMSIPFPLQ